MRNKHRLLGVIAALVLALPLLSRAQTSSLNAFSPYTFYGIGDLSVQGPTFLRSMGGVGVAYANPRRMNYLNPASYSVANPRSALFNVGMEMYNVYMNTAESKTSYNTFNMRDISLQLPIAKRIGFGFSMTPLSDVGYRVRMTEMDPAILANVGSVIYDYNGSGDIAQFKFGVGMGLFKNFALGVDLIYYHGDITREFNTTISSVISENPQRSSLGTAREFYSRIGVDFGVQYDIISNDQRTLTLGASYRPKLNLRPKHTRTILAQDVFVDTIDYATYRSDFYLPHSVTAGVFYQTRKWGMGVDYTYEKWENLNPSDQVNGIVFRNNNFIKAGLQFTPNSMDVRHYLNRCTYRVGYRYNNYYMNINGHNIDDQAITLGFGFPVRQGLTNINVGLELGQRGLTATGVYGTGTSQRQFQMVRERYFKVSLELSLFGEDYWFLKHKYQ